MRRRKFLQLSAMAVGASALPLFGVRAGASGKPAAHPVPVGLDPTLPVHPLLQYGAIAEPEKKVRVIVRKRHEGDDGHAIAQAGGATHLEEFAFVKCHAMELKQKDVAKLGQHKDVLYVSPSAPVQRHALPINPSDLVTNYVQEIEADKVWNGDRVAATGAGVTVAVVDSGVMSRPEIAANLVAVNVNEIATSADDAHGHGTHVTGIIKGRDPEGKYIGVAPNARVVSVKISDDTGAAHDADLLRGLAWCYDNRAAYNIRAINLSVSSSVPESYQTSPICAAVERLWFAGVVVIAAAGNRGTAADATWYAPSNDPYAITVGATDDNMTNSPGDDSLALFSGRGVTQDSVSKPDIVAPGRRIYSVLASSTATIAAEYPARIAPDGKHIRLSGTSMAAPVVTGAVALLLERYPNLTPDQVKWLMRRTWRAYGAGLDVNVGVGVVGMVDPNKALQYLSDARNAVGAANQGLTPSGSLAAAGGGLAFNNAYWDNAYWDNAYWDNAYWDNAYWDALTNYD